MHKEKEGKRMLHRNVSLRGQKMWNKKEVKVREREKKKVNAEGSGTLLEQMAQTQTIS